jgi:hypothetical protein
VVHDRPDATVTISLGSAGRRANSATGAAIAGRLDNKAKIRGNFETKPKRLFFGSGSTCG